MKKYFLLLSFFAIIGVSFKSYAGVSIVTVSGDKVKYPYYSVAFVCGSDTYSDRKAKKQFTKFLNSKGIKKGVDYKYFSTYPASDGSRKLDVGYYVVVKADYVYNKKKRLTFGLGVSKSSLKEAEERAVKNLAVYDWVWQKKYGYKVLEQKSFDNKCKEKKNILKKNTSGTTTINNQTVKLEKGCSFGDYSGTLEWRLAKWGRLGGVSLKANFLTTKIPSVLRCGKKLTKLSDCSNDGIEIKLKYKVEVTEYKKLIHAQEKFYTINTSKKKKKSTIDLSVKDKDVSRVARNRAEGLKVTVKLISYEVITTCKEKAAVTTGDNSFTDKIKIGPFNNPGDYKLISDIDKLTHFDISSIDAVFTGKLKKNKVYFSAEFYNLPGISAISAGNRIKLASPEKLIFDMKWSVQVYSGSTQIGTILNTEKGMKFKVRQSTKLDGKELDKIAVITKNYAKKKFIQSILKKKAHFKNLKILEIKISRGDNSDVVSKINGNKSENIQNSNEDADSETDGTSDSDDNRKSDQVKSKTASNARQKQEREARARLARRNKHEEKRRKRKAAEARVRLARKKKLEERRRKRKAGEARTRLARKKKLEERRRKRKAAKARVRLARRNKLEERRRKKIERRRLARNKRAKLRAQKKGRQRVAKLARIKKKEERKRQRKLDKEKRIRSRAQRKERQRTDKISRLKKRDVRKRQRNLDKEKRTRSRAQRKERQRITKISRLKMRDVRKRQRNLDKEKRKQHRTGRRQRRVRQSDNRKRKRLENRKSQRNVRSRRRTERARNKEKSRGRRQQRAERRRENATKRRNVRKKRRRRTSRRRSSKRVSRARRKKSRRRKRRHSKIARKAARRKVQIKYDSEKTKRQSELQAKLRESRAAAKQAKAEAIANAIGELAIAIIEKVQEAQAEAEEERIEKEARDEEERIQRVERERVAKARRGIYGQINRNLYYYSDSIAKNQRIINDLKKMLLLFKTPFNRDVEVLDYLLEEIEFLKDQNDEAKEEYASIKELKTEMDSDREIDEMEVDPINTSIFIRKHKLYNYIDYDKEMDEYEEEEDIVSLYIMMKQRWGENVTTPRGMLIEGRGKFLFYLIAVKEKKQEELKCVKDVNAFNAVRSYINIKSKKVKDYEEFLRLTPMKIVKARKFLTAKTRLEDYLKYFNYTEHLDKVKESMLKVEDSCSSYFSGRVAEKIRKGHYEYAYVKNDKYGKIYPNGRHTTHHAQNKLIIDRGYYNYSTSNLSFTSGILKKSHVSGHILAQLKHKLSDVNLKRKTKKLLLKSAGYQYQSSKNDYAGVRYWLESYHLVLPKMTSLVNTQLKKLELNEKSYFYKANIDNVSRIGFDLLSNLDGFGLQFTKNFALPRARKYFGNYKISGIFKEISSENSGSYSSYGLSFSVYFGRKFNLSKNMKHQVLISIGADKGYFNAVMENQSITDMVRDNEITTFTPGLRLEYMYHMEKRYLSVGMQIVQLPIFGESGGGLSTNNYLMFSLGTGLINNVYEYPKNSEPVEKLLKIKRRIANESL
jgi:hypothetical protein